MNETFIALIILGEAQTHQIDDYIDLWHCGTSDLSIHEFLGLSEKEYNSWANQDSSIEEIIKTRKNQIIDNLRAQWTKQMEGVLIEEEIEFPNSEHFEFEIDLSKLIKRGDYVMCVKTVKDENFHFYSEGFVYRVMDNKKCFNWYEITTEFDDMGYRHNGVNEDYFRLLTKQEYDLHKKRKFPLPNVQKLLYTIVEEIPESLKKCLSLNCRNYMM